MHFSLNQILIKQSRSLKILIWAFLLLDLLHEGLMVISSFKGLRPCQLRAVSSYLHGLGAPHWPIRAKYYTNWPIRTQSHLICMGWGIQTKFAIPRKHYITSRGEDWDWVKGDKTSPSEASVQVTWSTQPIRSQCRDQRPVFGHLRKSLCWGNRGI